MKTLLLFAQVVSRTRTVFRFCDGNQHFEVEKSGDFSIAGDDGACNQVDCVRGKAFSDWGLFTPNCQEILGAKILVPDGKVLLYEDKDREVCQIFSSKDEIYPYQLKLGKVLHFGGLAILYGGNIVTAPVKGAHNDVVLNVQGKAVFSTLEKEEEKERARIKAEEEIRVKEAAEQRKMVEEARLVEERKSFAREQQSKLRALGFDAVQSYQIIGKSGPADAAIAVEYAYRLYDLYASSNPTLKSMVVDRIMFDIKKIMNPDVWNSEVKIRAMMFSLRMPQPQFANTKQLRAIILGAKLALEIGLPGKRVKKHERSMVA